MVIMLSLPGAGAISYTFTQYSMGVEVGEGGDLKETITFTIKNTGEEPFSEVEYSPASSPQSLEVTDSQGALNHSLEGSKVVFSFREPLEGGESREVSIEYRLEDFVAEYQNSKILTFSYIPQANISNLAIRVALPPGSTLTSEVNEKGKSFSAVYPTPEGISTDGRRVIISWKKDKLNPQESFRIFVMYSPVEGESSYIPWLLLGLALGAGATYLKFRDRKEIAHLVLGEEEREVYDILLERDGSVRQDEVVKLTGHSKAKVSKLVRKLESKGVIEKEPYQKTNRLKLKEEFGGKA